MDPNANLKEQRALAQKILCAFDNDQTPDLHDVVRLATLAQDLDTWLFRLGALPRDWASEARK